MVKAPDKPDLETFVAPQEGSGKRLLILVGVAFLLAAVGGGLLLGEKLSKGGTQFGAESSVAGTPTFVPLETFTANLAAEDGDRFLITTMALKVMDPKAAEPLRKVMPEIRHRINLILSSRRASQLASVEGREDLAEEIREKTNAVLGVPPATAGTAAGSVPPGPVVAVLFTTFIVQ